MLLIQSGEEDPLVLSKARSPSYCSFIADNTNTSVILSQLGQSAQRLCWHNQDGVHSSHFCTEQTAVQNRPRLSMTMTRECPWGEREEEPCPEGFESVVLAHWSLSPHGLGLNIKTTMAMDHRLVCSPLNLTTFIHTDERGFSNISFAEPIKEILHDNIVENPRPDWPPPPAPGSILDPRWTWRAETFNGPNKYDKSFSGHKAFIRGTQKLLILPAFKHTENMLVDRFPPHKSLRFHPSRLDNDASQSEEVFILGYRAGSTWFRKQIFDPIFGAQKYEQSHFSPDSIYFYEPDYELTAMVCSEQYRFKDLKENGLSTPWTSEYKFKNNEIFEGLRDGPIKATKTSLRPWSSTPQ